MLVGNLIFLSDLLLLFALQAGQMEYVIQSKTANFHPIYSSWESRPHAEKLHCLSMMDNVAALSLIESSMNSSPNIFKKFKTRIRIGEKTWYVVDTFHVDISNDISCLYIFYFTFKLSVCVRNLEFCSKYSTVGRVFPPRRTASLHIYI